MSSSWHEKKKRLAEHQFERDLQLAAEDTTKNVVSDAAMGGGDEKVFEKKLSKEEKKALAKAKREAKRKGKGGGDGDDDEDGDGNATKPEETLDANQLLEAIHLSEQEAAAGGWEDDGMDHAATDALAAAGTICTFSASRKGVDARSRDINVQNFTLQHMGAIMLDETEIVLNHGNRYGIIARNGAGACKSCAVL